MLLTLPQRRMCEDITFRIRWQLALEMIDCALPWGVVSGVVVADSG